MQYVVYSLSIVQPADIRLTWYWSLSQQDIYTVLGQFAILVARN
jgi:hypothetical protein